MLKLKVLSFLMLVTLVLKGQVQPRLSKHVDVYKSADSIKQYLYSQGIDSVISYYRAWAYNQPKNNDNNDESKGAFLLWIQNGKLSAQRVSEYAVYMPEREFLSGSEFGKLFRYYLINRKEIDSNPIPFKAFGESDKEKSLSKLIRTEDDLNVLEYKFGKASQVSYWHTPMVFFESPDSDFAIFNLKAYTWASMIEGELKSQLNIYWKAVDSKIISVEETAGFATELSNSIKIYQEQATDFKLYHTYERQEFLLPRDFKGALSVVQKVKCGKELTIEDSVRKVIIPSDGIVLLNKFYMSYMQEFFVSSERKKTTAFRGDKNETLPVLEADETNRSVFGLYPLGDSSHSINGETYSVIVFYVGTFAEIEKTGRKKIIAEQVKKTRVDCK